MLEDCGITKSPVFLIKKIKLNSIIIQIIGYLVNKIF